MSSEDFDFAPVVFDESVSKTYDEQVADKFNQLASLNLNDVAESKNGLTYVSWSNAWKAFKEVYPTASYKIVKNPQTNLPYFVDPLIGIMVFTEVSANGLTYEMWLPVMDGAPLLSGENFLRLSLNFLRLSLNFLRLSLKYLGLSFTSRKQGHATGTASSFKA